MKLETQLDTFLLALANALKASPSLGDALSACTILLRPPISQELELMLKENALGTPLDQAILGMVWGRTRRQPDFPFRVLADLQVFPGAEITPEVDEVAAARRQAV